MMSKHRWTEDETRKLLKAVKRAKTTEEALAAIHQVTGQKLSIDAIDMKLNRLGQPRLRQIVAENTTTVKRDEKSAELARFATVAKKGGTLEEICDQLDLAPKKAKAMIEAAKSAGYRIELKAGVVGFVPPTENREISRIIAPATEEQKFAVISDLHIGSKYCLEDELRDFVHHAHRDHGVTQFFLGGDNLDGVYKHSRWEESHHGFDPQASRFAKVLPRLKGVRYDGIAGNHDETFEKESGLDVCRAIEDVFRREGRDDLRLHGHRGTYIRYAPKGGRGVLVELWHPLGGAAYAVSYKLQRHVEEYGVGAKPDFVAAGHWHQQCYVVRRGVHCFLAGTFHGGGSPFSKALGGAQAIGGWIIKYKQTMQGTIREVTPTWRAYYEKEEVRELGLT